MNLYQQAERFRSELLRGERTAAMRVTRAYGELYRRLSAEIDRTMARVRAARSRGESSPAAVTRVAQLERLRAQVAAEVLRFAREAEPVIAAQAEAAATMANDQARVLIDLATPPGVSVELGDLPRQAVLHVVSSTQPQTVLGQLLQAIGPETAQRMADALAGGIAAGHNPVQIAREMRHVARLPLSRALTISRTEVMRAWRESSREAYRRACDVVTGWVWWSALDRTTCPSCWAQHGSVHRADEMMATHPNCRCVMLPQTRSWRELGFDGPEPTPPADGPSRFARLPVSVQRQILGPSKFEAYRRRQVALADFVGHRRDPRWGPSTSEASLRDARENARRRRARTERAAA